MLSGSYFSPQILYMTVIGNSIKGEKRKNKIPLCLDFHNLSLENFAFESYHKVCGDGMETGDGVVPCCGGHLDDSVQITLEGVQHSHKFPGKWYGSLDVINTWNDVMLHELARKENATDS